MFLNGVCNVTKSWHLERRTFLRGAGAVLSLPFLEAMLPATRGLAASQAAQQPIRLLCIGVHLGFYGPAFFPKKTGSDYTPPALLQPINAFRKDFTVFSNLDHAGVGKGHPATVNFLTGVENPRKRKQVSLDQAVAKAVGRDTRFGSMQFESSANRQKGRYLSWAPGGIPLPQQSNPRAVFDRLFPPAKNAAERKQELADSRSILDHILEDANDLSRKLGQADNQKLDEYLAAIREVEREIQKAEKYASGPESTVANDFSIPSSNRLSVSQTAGLMMQLSALAFQANLTRVVTLRIPGENHPVSHHGQKKFKVASFVAIQKRYMQEFAKLLDRLKNSPDIDGSLLDHSMILLGSGMGNASAHSTRKLPVLLAGGGLRHGRHLRFAGKQKRPLSNLYVTMLQRMGISTGKFSNSRGTMNDLLT